MKLLSISKRFILITLASVIISNIFYALVVPFIMNYSSEARQTFQIKVIIATFSVGPIATLLCYLVYRPVEKAMLVIEGNGILGKEVLIKAQKAMISITKFLFLIGPLSFMAAVLLNFGTDYVKHIPIETDHLVSRLFVAVSWSILSGTITARFLNIVLIDARIKLDINNISELGDKIKYDSTTAKLFFPVLPLFLCITIFLCVATYHLNKELISKKSQAIHQVLDRMDKNMGLEQVRKEILLAETDNFSLLMKSLSKFILPAVMLFVIICLLYYLILMEAQKHIDNLKHQILSMNEGSMDLSRRIHIVSFDDIGVTTSGINGIIDRLSLTFHRIRESTESVFKTSGDTRSAVGQSMEKADSISGLVQALDESSSSQFSVISDTVGSMDRMVVKIEQSVQRIDDQSQAVLKTSEAIRHMVESFKEIQEKTTESTALFQELAKSIEKGDAEIRNSLEATKEINNSTGKVADIVKIIAEISDKSNMLAMNAAIEASHAGEFGKGFSIVASEVRLLSESTAESASNIEKLIAEMQKKNMAGLKISGNLKLILSDINEGMKNMGEVISLIAVSSRKQGEISLENIKNMDSLIGLTQSLKTDTDGMKNENTGMREYIRKLEGSSSNLQTVNRQLSESMLGIIDNLKSINVNFDRNFQNTHQLEELVASYKLE